MRLYNWIVTKLIAFRNRNERLFDCIIFLLLAVSCFILAGILEFNFHSVPSQHPDEAGRLAIVLIRICGYITLLPLLINILRIISGFRR